MNTNITVLTVLKQLPNNNYKNKIIIIRIRRRRKDNSKRTCYIVRKLHARKDYKKADTYNNNSAQGDTPQSFKT